MKKSDVQVNLRLPIELKEKIHAIAKKNNRTLNNELNIRLVASFNAPTPSNQQQITHDLHEFFENYQKSNRLIDISNRLHLLVNEANYLHKMPLLNPSLLAYQLDFDTACNVEAWFDGRVEPKFDDLKQIAKIFGCSEDWLLFGLGRPFQAKKLPDFDSFDQLIEFIITPDDPYNTLTNIYLIRCDNLAGELGILKQYNDRTCQFFTTDIYLNENLTEKQAYKTAFFSLVIYVLTHADAMPNCFGYVLDGELFMRLLEGKEHPLKVINKAEHGEYGEWCFDLFDISFGHDKKNWVNWADFYEKNLTFIKNTPYLNEIYTRLLNQQHPILQSNFPFFDIE